MSRIGRKPVEIKKGVTVEIQNGTIKVKGPKGELTQTYDPRIKINIETNQVVLTRDSDDKRVRALHGLYRALIQNMIDGVTEGYTKKLEIVGVGYRAEWKGRGLQLALGYSHPIFFIPPKEVKVEVPAPTNIVISGIDKQLVGQIAAKIRSFRPPEPYNGKGIRYEGEQIIRKAGKTAGK
ncbi:MAG: 50S ribosomal protein L6 [Ignavibacteria bacterium]|nr:50S ribosomal protein L6 [Ignavibacteria bacterium]MDH7528047.1 50S ribosomal protein L6 [Ignavibacteria bacterium]